jgi:hypothetical protein
VVVADPARQVGKDEGEPLPSAADGEDPGSRAEPALRSLPAPPAGAHPRREGSADACSPAPHDRRCRTESTAALWSTPFCDALSGSTGNRGRPSPAPPCASWKAPRRRRCAPPAHASGFSLKVSAAPTAAPSAAPPPARHLLPPRTPLLGSPHQRKKRRAPCLRSPGARHSDVDRRPGTRGWLRCVSRSKLAPCREDRPPQGTTALPWLLSENGEGKKWTLALARAAPATGAPTYLGDGSTYQIPQILFLSGGKSVFSLAYYKVS